MGQYYTLVSPTTGSCARARPLGSFIKALEQIWSSTPPAALALLCAGPRSTHPRDLPWVRDGLWAGHAPLMIGDYAEPTDLVGRDEILPAPEPKLYGLAGEKTAHFTKSPRKAKTAACVSESILPILERVLDVRFSDRDQQGHQTGRWGHMVEVRRSDSHPSGWDFVLPDDPAEAKSELEYYERCGLTKDDTWRRPAIHMSGKGPDHPVPDTLPSVDEAGVGDALLWVNIDRGEFIDPAALGDTPDLAGIMNGHASRAVMAMICHHDRRGGGDIGDMGPLHIAGRWRGDRIVLMGSKGFKPKKQPRLDLAGVRDQFVDATPCARVFIDANEIFGEEHLGTTNQPATVSQPDGPLHEVVRLATRGLTAAEAEGQLGANDPLTFELLVTPPMRLRADSAGVTLERDLLLPGRVDIRTPHGGKVCLSADAQRTLAQAVQQLSEAEVRRTETDGYIDLAQMQRIDMGALSNHLRVSLMAAE